VTSCSSCKNRRFEITYHLHHQGGKYHGTRNNASSVPPSILSANVILSSRIIFTLWWRRYFPPKRRSYRSHTVSHPGSRPEFFNPVSTSQINFVFLNPLQSGYVFWNMPQSLFGIASSKTIHTIHQILACIPSVLFYSLCFYLLTYPLTQSVRLMELVPLFN
jgi:hypothetical protein